MVFNPLKILPFFLCVFSGCTTGTTALCAPQVAGIAVYATPLSQSDPDRNTSATAYNGEPQVACAPTESPLPTPDGTPIVAQAGTLLNLDHNAANQHVQAVAVGDDSLAIGWEQAGDLWYATAHGGRSLKPRPFTAGQQIALAYSHVDRLHIAWEQDSHIYYASADDGDTVTDTPITIDTGTDPHILVDDGGWTHIIFTNEFGHFQHRRDRGNGNWIGVAAPASHNESSLVNASLLSRIYLLNDVVCFIRDIRVVTWYIHCRPQIV